MHSLHDPVADPAILIAELEKEGSPAVYEADAVEACFGAAWRQKAFGFPGNY